MVRNTQLKLLMTTSQNTIISADCRTMHPVPRTLQKKLNFKRLSLLLLTVNFLFYIYKFLDKYDVISQ
jgi:hypothetical protein